MPTLLLCGHGYLGQAISRDFLAASWDVTALSRSGDDDSLACDLSSASDVSALQVEPDFIVHCASSGRGGADAYRAVYLDGCRHLLARFPGVPLLYTSSTSVYAQTDGSVVTEESPAVPDRETGTILRETENLVLSSGGIITRLSGIYGPGRSVILKKFLSGEAVIEEDGRRFLNQIHRDDAAAAILHLALFHSTIDNQKSTIDNPLLFNLSDSTPLSQLETYQSLAQTYQGNRSAQAFGGNTTAKAQSCDPHRVTLHCTTGRNACQPCFAPNGVAWATSNRQRSPPCSAWQA
jgi:nucleoside-diphosphate-sugar epimerase